MSEATIPEGYCKCGCGKKTTICQRNSPEKAWYKGKPFQYLPGHRHPSVNAEALLEHYLSQDWAYPIGECQCGCGEKTNISTQNNTQLGFVKGKPFRYIRGHQMAFHIRHPEIGRLPEGQSYCLDCGQFKTLDKMKPDTQRLGKKRYQCITCALNNLTEYLQKNTEHGRRHHLKKKFKLTLEEYDEMLKKQNGVCAICGYPETAIWKGKLRRLAVDHCHGTGAIRGLLCMNCNNALGKFKHNPVLLQNAIQYLLNDINDDH